MVTNAREWKSKQGAEAVEVPLPSGNTALIKALKPEAFLAGGLLSDGLTSMVQKAISSKKGLPETAVQDMARDPKQLAAAMETFDRALVYCVVDPVVEMPPPCAVCGNGDTGGDGIHVDRKKPEYHRYQSVERDPDVLYADVVDMEDKQFIFQWAVGGVSDIEQFRKQLANAVGTVGDGESV